MQAISMGVKRARFGKTGSGGGSAGSAAVLMFGGLLLAGCPAQVYYTGLIAPPRPLAPRRPEDVELLVVTPPARPHTNVGLYQIIAGSDADDSRAMIQRLRAEAGARGCDAILITSIDNQSSKYTASNIQASCIVYNQPSVPAPPAAPAPAAPAPPSTASPPPPGSAAPAPAAGLPTGKI
jgi:hypothetical protein